MVAVLVELGTQHVFTLSGNQIMSVFDAVIDMPIELIHVRHEAAAVHMADTWGRLTGQPGVALVTAGPGFANCLSALYVARMAEAPLVLLSGCSPAAASDQGAFQQIPQAAMAEPVAKATWTVTSVNAVADDMRRALRIAASGRPGPVHLSLPVDVLEGLTDEPVAPPEGDMELAILSEASADRIVDALATANAPLVLAGPSCGRGVSGERLRELALETGVPTIHMESPRGVNDPSLGAFAEVLPDADVVALLGKRLDFTLQPRGQLALGVTSRLLVVDSEAYVSRQARDVAGNRRVEIDENVDCTSAAEVLLRATRRRQASAYAPRSDWAQRVDEAISYRPVEWNELRSSPGQPLHAVELCRSVAQSFATDPNTVFVSDGGEFGQWAQACVDGPRRVINGPSGAIGGSIPFAIAARLAFPDARVVAFLGDGTFGFHAMEYDTAVRYDVPFVAVVGNDAAWNAEYQIQLRSYGEGRTIGCELRSSDYDQVVTALGGHGERVCAAGEVGPAMKRAFSSGKPACLNVPIRRIAAPVVRRQGTVC